MTATVSPYLFFAGNAADAIDHYAAALGAEVSMVMRFRDAPEPMPEGSLPNGYDDKVMHATLRLGDQLFYVSDGDGSQRPGDGVALSVSVDEAAEAKTIFEALSDGGEVTMPLQNTFWSPLYGMLRDRFGVRWMVSVAE